MKSLKPSTDFTITITFSIIVTIGLLALRLNDILMPKWLVIAFYATAATNLVWVLTKMKGSKQCSSSCQTKETEGTPFS